MTTAVDKPRTVRSLILSDEMKAQFAAALPHHLTPEKFVRVALTAYNKTPKLADCTPESVMACLLDLAQMGLEPDGRKAHLIPFREGKGGKYICTLIVDYKGLVEMARRSGEVSDIHADIVCANDQFDFEFGTSSRLKHKPALVDRGEPIAAYSFVKLKDGSQSFEVLSKQEVDKVRERSKAGRNGPWVTDWNEMAKKTAFRRHSKWLPMASEFHDAVEKDYDLPLDITLEPAPQQAIEASPKETTVGELAAAQGPMDPDDPANQGEMDF